MKNETMGIIAEDVGLEFNNGRAGMRTVVVAVLALWLGLVSFLAYRGAFVGSANSPPWPIFFGVVLPLAVFLAAYYGWKSFRAFILGADVRLVPAIEAWRWGGLGFLSLYAQGLLPGLFALPAGLGDMAIGLSAPWLLLGLVRRPSLAASRRFVLWNILGLIDFVVAVSMGTLCSGAFPVINGVIGNVTTSPMARLPLVLVPAFMVPLFSMLHFTALFQARHLARSGESAPATNR